MGWYPIHVVLPSKGVRHAVRNFELENWCHAARKKTRHEFSEPSIYIKLRITYSIYFLFMFYVTLKEYTYIQCSQTCRISFLLVTLSILTRGAFSDCIRLMMIHF